MSTRQGGKEDHEHGTTEPPSPSGFPDHVMEIQRRMGRDRMHILCCVSICRDGD